MGKSTNSLYGLEVLETTKNDSQLKDMAEKN